MAGWALTSVVVRVSYRGQLSWSRLRLSSQGGQRGRSGASVRCRMVTVIWGMYPQAAALSGRHGEAVWGQVLRQQQSPPFLVAFSGDIPLFKFFFELMEGLIQFRMRIGHDLGHSINHATSRRGFWLRKEDNGRTGLATGVDEQDDIYGISE